MTWVELFVLEVFGPVSQALSSTYHVNFYTFLGGRIYDYLHKDFSCIFLCYLSIWSVFVLSLNV